MNAKTLSTIAMVAGLFGGFIGIWGLVAPGPLATPADVSQSFMWVAIGLLVVAIGVVLNSLAQRRG